MKIIGIAGWSGAGKTTLLTRLIPQLVAGGLSVSTIKHAHHRFDVDSPGEDSFSHRQAGAEEVLISSSRRYAQIHELRDEAEYSLADLLKMMKPVDLVLVEGFKAGRHPKIEVHRAANEKQLMFPGDESIVFVVCDGPVHTTLPTCDLNDIDRIADFVRGLAVTIDDRPYLRSAKDPQD